MPGVSEKNVEVILKDNNLTLTGTVSATPYNNLSPAYTEYNVGNYFRQFALNEDIDETRIEARIRNGVLEVVLPKRAKAMPRKIEAVGLIEPAEGASSAAPRSLSRVSKPGPEQRAAWLALPLRARRHH
jgi:hypothetical protein